MSFEPRAHPWLMAARVTAAALAVAALAAPLSAQAATRAASCNRACLKTTLDGYLAAVLKHDPAAAPLSAQVRETQGAVEMKPGQGIWRTAKSLGAVQRRYLDPVSGQAAYFGLMDDGAKAIVTVRIKVENRRITEAEWVIGRPLRSDSVAGLTDLPPQDKAPPGPKVGRAEMAAAASSYFEGLNQHNGANVRSTEGCNRVENGTRMTGVRAPGGEAVTFPPPMKNCNDKFSEMTQIAGVAHLRFPLVDDDAGVVLGIGMFLRPPGQPKGRFDSRLLVTEYFALDRGKITGIYTAMSNLPAEAPESTGWPDQAGPR